MRMDREMSPTALCIGCGHVRDRHTFDARSRLACTVLKCPCNLATDSVFVVAEYHGNAAK